MSRSLRLSEYRKMIDEVIEKHGDIPVSIPVTSAFGELVETPPKPFDIVSVCYDNHKGSYGKIAVIQPGINRNR